MLTATITLAGIPEFREKLERLSGRDLKAAILRGSDAAIALIVEKYRDLIDAEEPGYMKWRTHALLKQFRKSERRGRGKFRSNDTATSFATLSYPFAKRLEDGGRYRQQVHTYERRLTQAWGKPVKNPRTVIVNSYKRWRTEWAKHYLARAEYSVANNYDVPLSRALEALFSEERVPGMKELKAGL
jgi:hypothetical protein